MHSQELSGLQFFLYYKSELELGLTDVMSKREVILSFSPLLFFFWSGAGLSFAAGAVFGWTFGQEIANHWYQLYRLDTMAAQVKFLEWWENKCQRRS